MKRKKSLIFTTLSIIIFLGIVINDTSVLSVTSDTYVEDFTTTTKLYASHTDAVGWGSGYIELPTEDPVYADDVPVSFSCNFVFIEGNYAYLSCGHDGLNIYDITDPTNMVLVGYYNDSAEVNNFYSIDVQNDIAYIANGGDGVFLLNVTDKTNPTKLGEVDLYHAGNVKVQGNYVYVACNAGGIRVIDVTNPFAPVDVTLGTGDFLAASADAKGIAVSGNLLYVAVNYAGLDVYDITTPTTPSLLDNIDLDGYANKVKLKDNRAYVATDLGGLQIVDISDPYNLTRTVWLDDNIRYKGVALQDDYVFASGYEGMSDYLLKIYDISNPDVPKAAGFYILPSTGWDVAVSGYYLFIAAASAGMHSLQIADGGGYFAEDYKTSATAESSYVFFAPTAEQLDKVTVTASSSLPSGTSIDYYVSANYGDTWESVSLGVEHSFTAIGTVLCWKVELATSDVSVTPTLNSISLYYQTEDVGIDLLLPADGVYIQDQTPSFDWSDVSGAFGYQIQISTSETFRGFVVNESLLMHSSDYTVVDPLAYGEYYYWRVAYYVDYTSYSAFTDSFYFILDDNPVVEEFGVITSIVAIVGLIGISSTVFYIKKRKG